MGKFIPLFAGRSYIGGGAGCLPTTASLDFAKRFGASSLSSPTSNIIATNTTFYAHAFAIRKYKIFIARLLVNCKCMSKVKG